MCTIQALLIDFLLIIRLDYMLRLGIRLECMFRLILCLTLSVALAGDSSGGGALQPLEEMGQQLPGSLWGGSEAELQQDGAHLMCAKTSKHSTDGQHAETGPTQGKGSVLSLYLFENCRPSEVLHV